MKKVIAILMLAIVAVTALAGCSCNKAIFDTNYSFNYALVYEKGEWVEYEIKKWDDYDNDAICIWTKDGQMIYSSLNNIMLFNK